MARRPAVAAQGSGVTYDQVAIAELKHDPQNVRRHGQGNLDAVAASLRRFGQQKPIVATRDGTVIAGNATLTAARDLGWDTVSVRWTDLPAEEARAYAIADNRTAELAEWDEEALTEALDALKQFDGDLAIASGFGIEEIEKLVEGQSLDEQAYTAKIEAPIYEPRGERPQTADLCDRTKTTELLEQIARAEVPDDIRQFLAFAAERHTVFDFRRIAEYYAHADEVTQDLMERSALVIIDFDKAIEQGFVRLNKTLGKLADRDDADA